MTLPTAQLPTLDAPNYFSGQLLSDVDLDALVSWARGRLELGGMRDGYGVVNGLELRVDPRTGHEADLLVGPGYAISPDGQDIVVVSEQSKSLSGVQLAESDEPRARHAIDVFVQATRVRTRPQPGFGYGDEVEDAKTTYSRVSERFKLVVEPARHADPEHEAVRRFEEGYDECLAPLREFRGWLSVEDPSTDRIRQWLRTRLFGTEFRFAAYEIDDLGDDQLREEQTWVRALFWLIQHERNSFLSRPAISEERVRIGRVWLWSGEEPQPRTIVALDAHPPYRRRIAKRALPAPTGWVNAASVIWEREMAAHLALVEAGVSCGERSTFELPEGLSELEQALSSRLLLRPKDRISLLVYRHSPFGRRVVGVLPEEEVEIVVIEEPVVEGEPGDPTVVMSAVTMPQKVGTVIVTRHGAEPEPTDLIVGAEISIGHEGAHIQTDDDADELELDHLRRHGVLRVAEDQVVLEVTSRIPLELRGERVRRGEYALNDGDVIKIGRTEIRLVLER